MSQWKSVQTIWVQIAQGSCWQTSSPHQPERHVTVFDLFHIGVRRLLWMAGTPGRIRFGSSFFGADSVLLLGETAPLAARVFGTWEGGENSSQVSIISLQMNRFALDSHGFSLQGASPAPLLGAIAPVDLCRTGVGKAAFGLWSPMS